MNKSGLGTVVEAGLMVNPPRHAELGRLGRICRLGLATRGNTHLESDAVLEAIDHGVNYLNWCGHRDGMSQAVRRLGARRRDVLVAVQLSARTANDTRRELTEMLGELGTDYIDVVTYYYVEHLDEWDGIVAPGGAAEALRAARDEGIIRAIGLTTHQRKLAAKIVAKGRLDLLMIRYSAAHRGAEDEIFPVTQKLGIPVVAFTALRWGGLMGSTPEDPADFTPPPAPEWYRFVLCNPAVTVVLAAPNDEAELAADLALLDQWRGLSPEDYDRLARHGQRVRRHGGSFP